MLPSNLDHGTVEGRFIVGRNDGPDADSKPDYIAAVGYVDFDASIPYLPNPTASPAPVTILQTRITGVLDSEGYLCTMDEDMQPGSRGVYLIATDDQDILVTGWTWTVTYRFENIGRITLPKIPSHAISVPTDSVTDLTKAVRVPAAPPEGVPQALAAALRAEAAAERASMAVIDAVAEAVDINPKIAELEAKDDEQDGRIADAEAVTDSGPFYRRETLPDGTDFNDLNLRSANGNYIIGSTQTYLNVPPPIGARVPGQLLNVSTGSGDTYQMVIYRFGGGIFDRTETGAGTFSNWRRTDRIDDALFVLVNEIETNLDDLVGSNPMRVRGTLPVDESLDSLTARSDNGIWSMGGYRDGAPTGLTVGAKITVANSQNDRYMRVDYRSGGGSFERYGSTSWNSWKRVDRPFAYNGTLPDGTDFNDLRSTTWNGAWLIGSTQDYPNRPEAPGARGAGMVNVVTTGAGDTTQHVTYRFNGGEYSRYQTGSSSFSDWKEPGAGGDVSPEITDLQNRVDLLEQVVNPATPFELTDIFTSYTLGDTYMGWLARKYTAKLSILDLGESNRGLPIRAFQLGDPTKPTFYIIASQHGSEPMGREAAMIWVRELCEDDTPETATFLQNYCVVVTPCVNADRINVQRLSATGTDLNGNWPTESTAEITAASSVLKTHDVVITMDAHEGGLWETMQAAICNAPEIHQALKDVSQELYDAVEADFAAASEAFAIYGSASENLTQARNVIADRYKSATILFEGSSDLDNNMYAPAVNYRIRVYLLAYRSVFDYLKTNMNDFVVAKAAAMAV